MSLDFQHSMSIRIENVSKKYGKQVALRAISVQIDQGEVVGLLGPNGAGKSTLMKSIVNIIRPSTGTIEINRIRQEENPIAIKKIIGYLPENNPLYSEMYVREYLHFVATLNSVGKETVERIITQVGIEAEQNKKISQLSKGYKQRLGLAQAILHEPDILILDEPMNGLDPNQIIEIRNLISTLAKRKTVIISTHIMQEVEALCSRVIVLNKGHKIADESIQDFKKNYQSLEEAFYKKTTMS